VNRLPDSRPRAAVAVGAFAFLAAACSTPPPRSIPPPRQTIENTSWIGSCRGLDIGTYVITFGPATANRGSAVIKFPDPVKGSQTAGYEVTYPGGEQRLTLNVTPPWAGTFERDAENLNWDVRIGDTGKAGLCRLGEIKPASG
jgi:hypothetical protein